MGGVQGWCTYLTYRVNRLTSSDWTDKNPCWTEDTHVWWCELVWVVSPLFFDENVTGATYLNMLQTLRFQILGYKPLTHRRKLWFQQDAPPPPHCGIVLRQFLAETFPNKWIGWRGSAEWPVRSPDLTLLHCFLWRQLKCVARADRETLLRWSARYHQNVPI
jgi:hypothetical protein